MQIFYLVFIGNVVMFIALYYEIKAFQLYLKGLIDSTITDLVGMTSFIYCLLSFCEKFQ